MVDPPRLQQMLLSDGTWAECEVVAQARSRPGGWRVLVRWYDPGPPRAQREDWVVYEAACFREPELAHQWPVRGRTGMMRGPGGIRLSRSAICSC